MMNSELSDPACILTTLGFRLELGLQQNQMSSNTRFLERYKNDVDQHGFNLTSSKNVEPFIKFLSKRWFSVKIADIENIPSKGNAVLFGNHSGGLPVDGCL